MNREGLTPGDEARPPPILTRSVGLLLVTALGSLGSFYLLLPVVPLSALRHGAGGFAAGLCTGAMMLSTVMLEPAVPGLLRRLGNRRVMAAGLFLLGAPALALIATSSLPVLLVVCLARGAGLGIVVVAGTALMAELAPAERRGEAMGLYGAAVGVPSILCLPLGLWLVGRVGFAPVFFGGGALSLLALAAVPALPRRPVAAGRHAAVLSGLRRDRLARPALVFAAVTAGAGAIVTFLPLAVPAGSRQVAAIALLVQSCATPLARWAAGRHSDRHGGERLLIPAVLTAALGTCLLARVHSPSAVVTGMCLFGLGFGVAQNATLTAMLQRVSPAEFGRVSALWNMAYDGGMGVGAVGFGLLAGPLGYPTAFVVTAVVLVTALLPARREAGILLHHVRPA